MALLIPFRPSVGRYRFVTVIDGDQYVFRARWNTRDAAWYFDLLEYDETPIVEGVKVVLGAYLACRSNHPLLLGGVFVARSNATVHADPGFDDLGASVNVLYFTRAEIASEMLGSVSEAD